MGTLEKLKLQRSLIRAAVYARFSSDNQRDESIDAQLRAIREYATKNNVVIVEEYIDRARSATTDNRPEFLRMIKEASQHTFDVVLVHKLDRFARNRRDSIGYRMELKRHGVSLISILEYLDDGSPESVILESVLEAMAEYYSLNLAREVNKGMKENALKGLHTGGLPPLGYDVDSDTRKLIINESEAAIVRLVFERVIEGVGYRRIMEELNNKGYKSKVGNEFSGNSLNSILSNEKYIGTYVFNKLSSKDVDGKRNSHKFKDESEIIRIENAIHPIIEKEKFELVQQKMQGRKHMFSNRTIEAYLLTGKIFCGSCGGAYVGSRRNSGRDKHQLVTYGCNIRYRKKSVCCANKEIRREYIEGYVLEKLSELVFNDKLIPLIVDEYNHYLLYQNTEMVQQKKELEKRIELLEKDIGSVINLLTRVASDALIKKLKVLEEEKFLLESKLNQLYKSVKTDKVKAEDISVAFHKARQMLADGSFPNLKKIIELYVQKIVIYEDRADVYLNFQPHLKIPFDKFDDDEKHGDGISVKKKERLCAENKGMRGGQKCADRACGASPPPQNPRPTWKRQKQDYQRYPVFLSGSLFASVPIISYMIASPMCHTETPLRRQPVIVVPDLPRAPCIWRTGFPSSDGAMIPDATTS